MVSLVERRGNTGVLLNLLHQAAGSAFLLYKSLQMVFTHNQLIFSESKYKSCVCLANKTKAVKCLTSRGLLCKADRSAGAWSVFDFELQRRRRLSCC